MTIKHYAFIPARKGSVGLKDKNLILFKNTADFLKKNSLFDEVYVSSNDLRIKKISDFYDFKFHKRKNIFSGNRVSIKETLKNFITENDINPNSIIWLFYIPILYKYLNDFKKAKKITKRSTFQSLCSFKQVNFSPFNCWYKKNKRMLQYIKNDYFRRQDLPKTYIHYHYLCAFKTKYINNLNSELICSNTFPIILDKNTSSKLIEIDTIKDLKKIKNIKKFLPFQNIL